MKIGKTELITFAILLLVIVAVAVYMLFFIDESEVQKRDNTPAAQALLLEEGQQSFTTLNGDTVSVSDHFGKIMVVSSWASWCPECNLGLTQLSNLADEFKDKGVVVLAINRAENRFTAERYLQTVTLSENLQIIIDPEDHYFGASAGYAMPETIIYTKDGQEALHQRGYIHIDELKSKVTELTN